MQSTSARTPPAAARQKAGAFAWLRDYFLVFAAAALIGSIVLFLIQDKDIAPIGTIGANAPTEGAVENETGETAGPKKGPSREEIRQRQIVNRLEETLAGYEERASIVDKALRDIETEHPEIEQLEILGLKAQRECNQDREIRRQFNEYLKKQPDRAAKLAQAADSVCFLAALVDYSESKELVANEKLGTIVRDLVINTEYFEMLKMRAARTAREQMGNLALAQRLSSVDSPSDLLLALQEAGDVYRIASVAAIAQEIPDDGLQEYAARWFRAQALTTLASYNKKSWISPYEKQIKENARDLVDMMELLNQLPMDSEERARITTRLVDINEWHGSKKGTANQISSPSNNQQTRIYTYKQVLDNAAHLP